MPIIPVSIRSRKPPPDAPPEGRFRVTTREADAMTETTEVKLRRVTVHLCEPCLNGEAGECHTPGCSLWMNRAPDVGVITYEDIYHSFARDELIDALSHLEVTVATSGPIAGKVLAESMADAIIEALETGRPAS